MTSFFKHIYCIAARAKSIPLLQTKQDTFSKFMLSKYISLCYIIITIIIIIIIITIIIDILL